MLTCPSRGGSNSAFNLGDIIRDGRDIYGDDVNIAARPEALAEPGAVFVSSNVYENVRDRLSVAFEDLGEHQVKNIARPVHVYRVLDPKLAVAHDNLGLVYWDQDKPEMAIAEYQTAIQLDPKDALPHKNLGNILYSEQGKPEMAISELKTAIYMTRNLWGHAQKASEGCNKAECRLQVSHIRRSILTEDEQIAEFIRTRGVDRRKPGERALSHMRERDWQAIAQGEAGIVRGNPTKPGQKPAKPGQRRVRRARIGGR